MYLHSNIFKLILELRLVTLKDLLNLHSNIFKLIPSKSKVLGGVIEFTF